MYVKISWTTTEFDQQWFSNIFSRLKTANQIEMRFHNEVVYNFLKLGYFEVVQNIVFYSLLNICNICFYKWLT